jgi:hypothetical protein
MRCSPTRGTTLAWTPVIPLGIKEEQDRARLVVDHTWFLINQHTLEWTTKRRCNLAVSTASCERSTTPTLNGPVYLAKYDIKVSTA